MQSDIFASAENKSVELPQLVFGPIRTSIGHLSCLMRPGGIADVISAGTIEVSSRTAETSFVLANGEVIVITSRRGVLRPASADGVLLRGDKGYKWSSHKLIDNLMARAAENGWPRVVSAIAHDWDPRFVSQAVGSFEGEADPKGLRPPQIGALHAIGAHWSLYRNPATVVMPTGTGKTETMLSTLAAYVRQPLLVIVPSDALRSQTARKFVSFGLLRKLGILTESTPNPIVGVITKVPKKPEDLEMFSRCNVVVATMSSMAADAAEPLWPEIADKIGVVIIDEAHHVGARRWSRFKQGFASKPILQFTATPFRRDGALVDGQVIFSYPLRMAQTDGYFRKITFEPVYEPNSSRADAIIAATAVARLRSDLAQGVECH